MNDLLVEFKSIDLSQCFYKVSKLDIPLVLNNKNS